MKNKHREDSPEGPRLDEEWLWEAWQAVSDAIAISDADGIVLAANPAYFHLYGFS